MDSDPRTPSRSDDLRAALADVAPEERAALERVWDLLGEAAPPPDERADQRWRGLRSRLDTAHAAPAARRAADRAPETLTSRRRWPARVALGAAIGLAALFVWFGVPASRMASPGQTLAVTLPDGSSVALNSGAEIVYPRRFGGVRTVTLRGEAFFDVVPGPSPFVVETHNARVEVLGTAFNVRAYTEESETSVALLEGRLRVAAEGGAAAQLAAGEAVVVGPTSMGPPAAADVERAAAWRAGALTFEDRPLRSVLAEVERRYDVTIEPAAGAPLDARVSAFYAARPTLEALLGDLGAAAGVRFSPTAGGYTVRPAAPARNEGEAPRLPRADT